MAKYVAFLRGINLGRRQIKMDTLRKAFEGWGYKNVRTLLASGNVVFEADEKNSNILRTKIQASIKKEFGFDVSVILRSEKGIKKLVDGEPFKSVKATPKTRLYVTFLSEKPKSTLKTPYKSLAGDYRILQIANDHVVSALTLSPESGTVDAMEILEKEFGKDITTRNWNTIKKLAAALE